MEIEDESFLLGGGREGELLKIEILMRARRLAGVLNILIDGAH